MTNTKSAATRMTASIGAATLMLTSLTVPGAEGPRPAVSAEIQLLADATALVLCGTTCPTPDSVWVDAVKNQFVAPTHPGEDIDYIPVTAPMEFWPVAGAFRLLAAVVGPASIWGPGGPGWPDQPWWKLTGLFDLTGNQSLRVGVAALEAAMAENGNDHLVIQGTSQGAGVANAVKKRLAESYPAGTIPPDIDFVLNGDPNLPNGGLMARFAGLYIPILDLTFNGPAATDTPFETVEVNRQYDGFSDFPLYPINLIADLNAVLGILYRHTRSFDVSLPADPTTSPAYQGSHRDTSYYFFETQDLPLFDPLRQLGVPEPLIDVVEPFFRVLIDLGYDRSIPPWEPTPARLIPRLEPVKVAADLFGAIGEGIKNAGILLGLQPPAVSPGAPTVAAGAAETPTMSHPRQVSSPPDEPEGSRGTPRDRPADRDSLRTGPQRAERAEPREGRRPAASQSGSATKHR